MTIGNLFNSGLCAAKRTVEFVTFKKAQPAGLRTNDDKNAFARREKVSAIHGVFLSEKSVCVETAEYQIGIPRQTSEVAQ